MTKSITKDLTVPYRNGFTMQAEDLTSMKSLKEVCTEFGITRKTLFYYDKIGLLNPSQRVGSQNTKYYSEKKCKQLKEIIAYKEAGFPLKTIQTLLKETPDAKIHFLEENIKTLEATILSEQSKIKKKKKKSSYKSSRRNRNENILTRKQKNLNNHWRRHYRSCVLMDWTQSRK